MEPGGSMPHSQESKSISEKLKKMKGEREREEEMINE